MRRYAWLAILGLSASGCTLYVLSQLSGKGGSNNNTELGGCFQLPNNQCGQCIAQQCEIPDASPPVSLAQVCALDPTGEITIEGANCASQPDITSTDCAELFQEGGAYSPTIGTAGAAENNLRKCIFDRCVPSCSECLVTINGCTGSVPIAEAGACGACLDQAMNAVGSACQPWVLQGGCIEDPSGSIAACAGTGTQCQTSDCSGLSAPDPSLIDAGYALYQCLWTTCSGACQ